VFEITPESSAQAGKAGTYGFDFHCGKLKIKAALPVFNSTSLKPDLEVGMFVPATAPRLLMSFQRA